MIAYRHTSEKYARSAVMQGNFRLWPLSYFRNLEDAGSLIPDELEGLVRGHSGSFDSTDYAEKLKAAKAFGGVGLFGGNFETMASKVHRISVTDCVFENTVDPGYVLCLSEDKISSSLESEGRASTVVVSDVYALATAIYLDHASILGVPLVGKVQYGPREWKILEDSQLFPDVFVKRPTFSAQNEIRIFWPAIKELDFVDVNCAAAREYLDLATPPPEA